MILRIATTALGVIAGIAALCADFSDARAQKAEPQKVEMGFVAKLAFSWPVFIAINKGWMAENGIKLEPVMVGQSAKVVQQLAAAALPLGHAGAPDAIRGIEYLYDPKNGSEVIEVLIKETGAKPDDAAKTHEFYVKELQPFRRDAAMTPEAMKDILKSLVTLEELKEPLPPASKYYDDSFLRAARAPR
jgi:hypothetical protein